MNKQTLLFIFVTTALTMLVFWGFEKSPDGQISNFEDCVHDGVPVMESYPRQCRSADGETFIENIGNKLEKGDLIRINTPRPNQVIESPLVIEGEARGTWFFEGDFPVILTDWDGVIIAEWYATAYPPAGGEWMTEDFVPFGSVIEFEKPIYGERGTLILRKDNPSGMPALDDALEIPIFFAKENVSSIAVFDSGVRGSVLLGPQCPVVREGEDCLDKPYQTIVDIFRLGGTSIFVTVGTDKDGQFEATLPPGEYVIHARGGKQLPICGDQQIAVSPVGFTDMTILCDSGIR